MKHDVHVAHAALVGIFRQRHRDLSRGHAVAAHVRVLGHDVRGRCVDDEDRHLRLRRHGPDGDRVGREDQPRQQVDVLLHDQLLREPLGVIGSDPAVVARDDLDLAAVDRVAVLFLEHGDDVVEFLARGTAGARERIDDADLDRRLLAEHGARAEHQHREREDNGKTISFHAPNLPDPRPSWPV